jgi:sphinganine-1-phosphate aldolase
MTAASSTRTNLPVKGTDWPTLQTRMRALSEGDADWRNAKTAVYVFNAGEDVLAVAKDAYAMYQSENGLGPLAFPSIKQMEAEVVQMGLDILNGPEGSCGNMTSGGSESIFMAVKTCRDQAAAAGRDVRDAEIVLPYSAHLAFDKAAGYLGLKIVRVPIAADYYADPVAMEAALTERTIMLVGSAPCFPYGLIDPIEALGEIAERNGVWLHVDACVGGYFNAFARQNGAKVPPFDFSVPGVASISADLHKYGYAAKGASTIFHRSEAQRAFQLFDCEDWPGGHMSTPTAAGTRPGGAIAGAWAVLNYLGNEGYCEKARAVTETRERLMAGINAMPGLCTFGDPELGLFIFGAEPGEDLDIFKVYGRMFARGWFSALVTEPRAIHMMLSPAHADVVDVYLSDLAAAVAEVRGGEGEAAKARYS